MDCRSLVPHYGDMVFVDEVLSYTQDSIFLKTTIKEENPFLKDGVLPSFALIEIMAQGVASLAGCVAKEKGEPPTIGFLLGCRKLELFCGGIEAGSTLFVNIKGSLQDENGFGVYDCELLRDEACVAKGRLNVFSPDEAFLAKAMNKD